MVKRKFWVFLLSLLLIFVQVLPVFAYSGGLLDGVILTFGGTNLTDNDLATSATFDPNYSTSYTFPNNANISQVRVYTGSVTDTDMQVLFYNSANTLLLDKHITVASNVDNYFDVTVINVKKVVLGGVSVTNVIKEFNVYGVAVHAPWR